MKTCKTLLTAAIAACALAIQAESLWEHVRLTDKDQSVYHQFTCTSTRRAGLVEKCNPRLVIATTPKGTVLYITADHALSPDGDIQTLIVFKDQEPIKALSVVTEGGKNIVPSHNKDLIAGILEHDSVMGVMLNPNESEVMFAFYVKGFADEVKKYGVDLGIAPPKAAKPKPMPKLPTFTVVESVEKRVDKTVRDFVLPKLKDESTYKPGRLTSRTHRKGTLWLQSFEADGRKWRVGVLETGSDLTVVPPSKLQTMIKQSK